MPPESKQPKKPAKGIEEEVIAYFEEHFGPVDPRSLSEIVPTGLPITVHAIRSSKERPHITLFTTGLAQKRMKMPKEFKDYQYAELFIQLPANWPNMDIATTDSMSTEGSVSDYLPLVIARDQVGVHW
jgi:hypothetical protein